MVKAVLFKIAKINIIHVIRIPKAWLLVMLFLSKDYSLLIDYYCNALNLPIAIGCP
jgi:hypothetical protein